MWRVSVSVSVSVSGARRLVHVVCVGTQVAVNDGAFLTAFVGLTGPVTPCIFYTGAGVVASMSLAAPTLSQLSHGAFEAISLFICTLMVSENAYVARLLQGEEGGGSQHRLIHSLTLPMASPLPFLCLYHFATSRPVIAHSPSVSLTHW